MTARTRAPLFLSTNDSPSRPAFVLKKIAHAQRIDVHCLRIDVDQQRPGPDQTDRLRSGEKGPWRHDDAIPRANAQGAQGQNQRCGAGIDGNAMSGAAIGGELPLERLHVGAEHQLHRRQRFFPFRPQLRLDLLVLGVQIDHAYVSFHLVILMQPPVAAVFIIPEMSAATTEPVSRRSDRRAAYATRSSARSGYPARTTSSRCTRYRDRRAGASA